MKKILLLIILGLGFTQYIYDYKLDTDHFRELPSSSIIDLQLGVDKIEVGTSGGLGFILNESGIIETYSYIDNNLPIGGNPALQTYPEENLILLSGVTTLNYFPNGTGVSWSIDNGDTAIGKGLRFPLVISTSINAIDFMGSNIKNISRYLNIIFIPPTSLLRQNLIVNLSIFHSQLLEL